MRILITLSWMFLAVGLGAGCRGATSPKDNLDDTDTNKASNEIGTDTGVEGQTPLPYGDTSTVGNDTSDPISLVPDTESACETCDAEPVEPTEAETGSPGVPVGTGYSDDPGGDTGGVVRPYDTATSPSDLPTTDPGKERPDVDTETGDSTEPYDTGDSTDPFDTDWCITEYRDSYDDYCQVVLDCDGDYVEMYCYDEGRDELYCYCNNGRFNANYEVSNISAYDACSYLIDSCLAGETLTSDVEPDCTLNHESSSDTRCNVEYECEQKVDIGDGVIVGVNDWRYAYCDKRDESWSCDCDGGGNYLQLEIAGDADSEEVCHDALYVCQSPEAVSNPTEMVCDDSSQSSSRTWCETEIECKQQAVVDETLVSVSGFTYSRCERESEEDTNWECECGGGYEVAYFDMNGEDAWDTCTEAAALCIERVYADGEIGGGDRYYYGDDIWF